MLKKNTVVIFVVAALLLLAAGATTMYFVGKAQYGWKLEKPLDVIPEQPANTPSVTQLIIELEESEAEINKLRSIVERQAKSHELLLNAIESQRVRRSKDDDKPLLKGDALASSLDSLAGRYWNEKLRPKPDPQQPD